MCVYQIYIYLFPVKPVLLVMITVTFLRMFEGNKIINSHSINNNIFSLVKGILSETHS